MLFSLSFSSSSSSSLVLFWLMLTLPSSPKADRVFLLLLLSVPSLPVSHSPSPSVRVLSFFQIKGCCSALPPFFLSSLCVVSMFGEGGEKSPSQRASGHRWMAESKKVDKGGVSLTSKKDLQHGQVLAVVVVEETLSHSSPQRVESSPCFFFPECLHLILAGASDASFRSNWLMGYQFGERLVPSVSLVSF